MVALLAILTLGACGSPSAPVADAETSLQDRSQPSSQPTNAAECTTAFIFEPRQEFDLVLATLGDRVRDVTELWFRSASMGGAMRLTSQDEEQIRGMWDGMESRSGDALVTQVRLRGVLNETDLAELGEAVHTRLVVHESAVLTEPYLEGDPVTHVVKSFGSC